MNPAQQGLKCGLTQCFLPSKKVSWNVSNLVWWQGQTLLFWHIEEQYHNSVSHTGSKYHCYIVRRWQLLGTESHYSFYPPDLSTQPQPWILNRYGKDVWNVNFSAHWGRSPECSSPQLQWFTLLWCFTCLSVLRNYVETTWQENKERKLSFLMFIKHLKEDHQ